MPKIRVYQLARELNRDNSEVIRELQHLGAPVTSHSNTVEDRMADQLRQTLGVLVTEGPGSKGSASGTLKVETPPEPAPEKVRKAPEPKLVKAKPKPPAPPVEAPPPPRIAEVPSRTAEAVALAPPPLAEPPRATLTPRVAAVPQPAPRPAAAPPEERKTMQQLAQERLRQQNRPVPQQVRRPPVRESRTAPIGRTVPARPRGPEPPHRDGRRERARPTRAQRVERTMDRRPMPRPQPKPEPVREFRRVTLTDNVTVKDIAEKLDVRSKDIIQKLMERGMFATINQTLDKELATQICQDFNAGADFVTFEESVMLEAVEVSKSEKEQARPPVVTIMGHVDHGKTSLLDAIRQSRITEQEHGGITQHIGAYQVPVGDRRISFLDTPGHEAFTLMRARGASVTDVVILVVAADDGVMPQTVESISHTRAANVPLLVAINKIDVPSADVDRVKRELADKGLLAEDWGGDTVMVEVSAKQKKNIDLLLEMILLVADLRQLTADPDLPAMGTVLEAKLDRGRGNVATMLVQNGTLRVGDNFIVGAVYGKVRAMYDELSQPVEAAGPSMPVEVLGLQGLPRAGDPFQVITDDTKARQIAQFRQEKQRETALAKSSRLTLDQLHLQMAHGDVKEVPIILKADVQGSAEVLTDMLGKLATEKVQVRIIHAAVGAITEYDVLLAATSNAIIIGFNVRPEKKAAEIAAREHVDIRLHTVIYNVVDEIKQAMAGVLEPIIKETRLGSAEVRDTFRVPRIGTIAGCYITDGRVSRNAQVRLLRDNVVVYEGKISSLKRFKEDASEVRSGYECGIGLQNFNDIKVGDVIEAFVTEKVTADIGV